MRGINGLGHRKLAAASRVPALIVTLLLLFAPQLQDGKGTLTMGHQQPEYAPIQLTLQKKAKLDFPGGPGVETLSSSAEGTGCIPGWGIKIPHVAKKRQKATP